MGRPATREEQAELALYVGWGGIKGAFPHPETKTFDAGFEDVGARVKELLTKSEYRAAERSIQYAHFTAENVVRAMWNAAGQFGFTGGNVFEPGMGVGNFVGMMPPDLAGNTQYSDIENDPTTGRIARLLYPESGVRVDDFFKMPLPEDMFDLVIGNPPFGDIAIKADPKYRKNKFLIHDYFFAKSLDSVRPGGLLMFVSSAGTMNKMDAKAREFMAERADFVGAVRLPGDAFAKNAGTSVTTDIIVLRKKSDGVAPPIISIPKRIISAIVCWIRARSRGSKRHTASRSAMPSQCSIPASNKIPASEVNRPPSKTARTRLPPTGDRPGRNSLRSSMAGANSVDPW